MESSLVTFLPIGLVGFEDADDSVVESEIGRESGVGWIPIKTSILVSLFAH